MSNHPNHFWSECYGRLEWVSRATYMRGNFRYVATEADPADPAILYDIVEDRDTGEWYFTVI